MSRQTPAPTASQVREAWDAVADGFDRFTTPYTLEAGEQVVARLPVGPSTRVLDIGAGSGALSIPAARTGAEVVAVDISPRMVARLVARARAGGLERLDAQVGDGTALDHDAGAFDVTMSMNGVSLFPDLPQGLREAARVTRPGGLVAIVTFGPLPQVEFVAWFLAAVRTVAPQAMPAPVGPLPPFRLAEPEVLADALEGVGLARVDVETIDVGMRFSSVDGYLDAVLSSNPIARQLAGTLDDDGSDQLRQVLDRMLRERSGGGTGAELRVRFNIGRGHVRRASDS